MDGIADRAAAALAAAADAHGACGAVVEALAAGGALLPSAYLVRGGRLRCMASHGYWQVRDGVPPGAGILGRTYARGREELLQDVRGEPRYLEAAAGVVAELCVPLRIRGVVLGVLNVEAARALTDAEIEGVRGAAAALAARIDALGGPPVERPSERLARHVVRLGELRSADAVEREALAAALDLVALRSALLLQIHADGRAAPRRAAGPLAALLMDADQGALRAICALVEQGSSCYTVADPGEALVSGMASLRGTGAASVAAFGAPVGDDLAVLVLADERPAYLESEDVERLELLTAHVGSCLRTAVAVEELQRRAATDPLTGLGHHATFHAALAALRVREETAVLVCDVDGFKRFNDTRGHQEGDRLLRAIAEALTAAVRRGDAIYRIGGDEFAALVRVADAGEALDAGHRLRAAVAEMTHDVTLSIGVALPDPGEPDAAVLARADQAMYGVKAGGRDGVALAPRGISGQQALPL